MNVHAFMFTPPLISLLFCQSLKEDAATKEAELRGHIEKLRTEKRELEARSGGVDLAKVQVRDRPVWGDVFLSSRCHSP